MGFKRQRHHEPQRQCWISPLTLFRAILSDSETENIGAKFLVILQQIYENNSIFSKDPVFRAKDKRIILFF